jgi:hypothetical protein
MRKEKSPVNAPEDSRRAFITKLPMAAAAIMLSGSFGFPVESEQGRGQLYMKVEGGIFQLPARDLDNLKRDRLGTLNIKWEISSDMKNWEKMSTRITEKSVIDQLSRIAKSSP